METDIKIPILLLEDYLSLGIQKSYVWEPAKVPHAIVIGGTGSGKTYFSKILLGKICTYKPTTQLIICDFKGDDDFCFLEEIPGFYRFTDCFQGIEDFYQCFLARQQQKDKSRNPLVLFFDEFASAVNHLDKKDAEELKKKVATLLMLGRSFSCFLVFALQRADAAYFASARDNFNLVVALGNLSEESKDMFFHSVKEQIIPDRRRGTGYLLESGTNLQKVVVPAVKDIHRLHLAILKHMVAQGNAMRTESEQCN